MIFIYDICLYNASIGWIQYEVVVVELHKYSIECSFANLMRPFSNNIE